MNPVCVLTTTLSALVVATGVLAADKHGAAPLHWYRCNTHTHTSARPNSDANGSAELAVRWYQEHGYQCLVITDHEYLTDVGPLNVASARRSDKNSEFLVIRGQEITQAIRDPSHPNGVRQAHVNGINIAAAIKPVGYPDGAPLADTYWKNPVGLPALPEGISLAETFQRNIAAVYAAGGIAQVNHPNLHWSVRLDDLLPITQPFLLEIWNAFPSSNNLGGPDEAGHVAPSTEELWDALLSRGKLVYGVGSDDVHEYGTFDDPESPTPGKAWIVVQAPSLTLRNVTDALRQGRFYASTGITLDNYSRDRKAIALTIAQPTHWKSNRKLLTRYVTRFIGANGRVLAEVPGLSPRYTFKGDEQYVRASITDSDGRRAWTQPVFFDARRAAEET